MSRVKNFFKENIFFQLFVAFFQVGLFSIGGGMTMIPLLQERACNKYGWFSEDEMVDCIAVSQSLPGAIAINMATYVGYAKKGFLGALAASIGIILPSFIIIILVVCFLEETGGNPYIEGALTGIRAAATGLIAYAAVNMGKQVLKGWFHWLIAVAAFIAIGIFGVNVAWAILGSMVLGIIYTTIVLGKKGEKDHAAD